MTFVKQKNKFDCGVACLAMMLGQPSDVVIEQLGYNPGESKAGQLELGVTDSEVTMLMHLHALTPLTIITTNGYRTFPVKAFTDTMPLRKTLFDTPRLLQFIARRKAILTVASLNSPGQSHFIFWRSGTIFDPSNRRLYDHNTLLTNGVLAAIVDVSCIAGVVR